MSVWQLYVLCERLKDEFVQWLFCCRYVIVSDDVMVSISANDKYSILIRGMAISMAYFFLVANVTSIAGHVTH